MGREVTGIPVVDKRPNAVTVASNGSSNDKARVLQKIATTKVEAKDDEVEKSTGANSPAEKGPVKKDVLGANSTNHDTEKHDSKMQTVGAEAIETGGNLSPNADNTHSPSPTKNSEVFEI